MNILLADEQDQCHSIPPNIALHNDGSLIKTKIKQKTGTAAVAGDSFSHRMIITSKSQNVI